VGEGNTTATGRRDRFWLTAILILSAAVVAAVAYLLLAPRPTPGAPVDVSALPGLNAVLNALAAAQLVVAYMMIRRRRVGAHRAFMLGAFGASVLFLVSYVTYHSFSPGPRGYTGDLAWLYFIVLVSHILLAVAVVPLALITLYRGWTTQISRHRAIARFTLPIWLYVSVTGVVVYAMLYW